MNILVYSGDGTSRASLIHTVNSLRSLVGQHYDVMKIDDKGLLTEPWEESTSLLVIPGGRDLPYVRDLNGTVNHRIGAYVHAGGRFLGICAGAYYAADRIVFEQGLPLQVQGPRELKFFPGECRGAVYPGFVYESERGANAVGIELDHESFAQDQLGFDETKVYFNGGGYFVDAEKHAGTKILAWYKNEPGQIDAEVTKKAAMVACQVGQGLAILTGVHPEYDATHLDPRNPEYGPQPNVVTRLMEKETERRLFLRSVLAKMGLKVAQPEPVKIRAPAIPSPSGVIHGVPAITPLYLASIQPSYTTDLSTALFGLADANGQIKELNDTFQLIPSPEHPIPEHAPILPEPDDGEEEPKVIKNIVLCPTEPPSTTLTPEFDMGLFFQSLQQSRLQAPIQDPFSHGYRFGNSLIYGHVVTSTQTMLDKNFGLCQQLPDGVVCNATIQVSGRGRGRNSWISPPGCLQFSMVLRHPVQAAHASAVFVQYLVGLAVVEGVCSLAGYEELPLKLKWPNDIYAEAPLEHPSQAQAGVPPKLVKIGGILVTGKNLSLFTQETLLARILFKLEQFHTQFLGGNGRGFAQFEEMYYRRWLHSDALVMLTTMTPHKRVRIKGVTLDYGLLRTVAVDDQGRDIIGEEYRLQPDGNSFDMLKGLVFQKS
ncbi:biotin holocarboxylase synthetase [Mortierella sp. NVP85]|nr:biotin holocarboxylase synthetase [Mortierella sp. NVP85]